jgi:hypothetical protein
MTVDLGRLSDVGRQTSVNSIRLKAANSDLWIMQIRITALGVQPQSQLGLFGQVVEPSIQ